jgi:hypothetical protein
VEASTNRTDSLGHLLVGYLLDAKQSIRHGFEETISPPVRDLLGSRHHKVELFVR